MRIKCRNTKEIVYNYSDYLKTEHWRNLRELSFQKAQGICKCCKKPLSNNFICHHKTYWRIGRERINHRFLRDDVIAVCPHCHNGESKNHERLHEFVRVPHWARIEKENF